MSRFDPMFRRSGGTSLLIATLVLAATVAPIATAAPGDIDPGFGLEGRALVDFGVGVAQAHAMARLPDGRIALAGVVEGEVVDDACAVAMLTAGGALDDSFGTDGRVVLDYDEGRVNTCIDMAVQPDGRIVLVGSRDTGSADGTRDFMVIRLLGDGTLDESFSGNGYAFANFALPGPLVRSVDEAYAVALQPDGGIVVAGRAERAVDDFDVAVARFLADGTRDDSFGSNGRVAFGIDDDGATFDEATAVAIQTDGRIVVAGTSATGDSRMLVARLTADGQPDGSFNLTGHRLIEFGLAPQSIGTGLAIRGDGTLLLGGYAGNTETADFAAAAVRPDGTLDAEFGVGGRVTIDLGDEDGAFALATDADGRLLLGGIRIVEGNVDMAAVRLLPDGTPDVAFGDEGQVIVPFDLDESPGDQDIARAILVQSDGSIVLGGVATVADAPLDADFAVVRLQGDDDTLFADGFEATAAATR